MKYSFSRTTNVKKRYQALHGIYVSLCTWVTLWISLSSQGAGEAGKPGKLGKQGKAENSVGTWWWWRRSSYSSRQRLPAAPQRANKVQRLPGVRSSREPENWRTGELLEKDRWRSSRVCVCFHSSFVCLGGWDF